MRQGVYFSANDRVYNWTLAFLKSFRIYNPDLELWWIPFNELSGRIAALSSEYNFKTFQDPSFPDLEKLGEAYELGHTTYGKYWFRRYAAFWGPLDYFIYLDARQLVLSNLQLVLEPLVQNKMDFLYYDLAIDQVYQPGNLRQQLLLERAGRGFLSGIWAGRKGLFQKEEMIALGYESIKKRDQLNPRNTDQAFINYCIDHKIDMKTAQMAEYLGGYVHQSWAGQRGRVYKKGNEYYLWDYGGLDHKKRIMLLHWAGYAWEDSIPQPGILNFFSKPSLMTRIRRFIHYLKRQVKSNFYIRKWRGDV